MITKNIALKLLSIIGISDNDIYLFKSIRHNRWIRQVYTSRNRNIPIQPFSYSAVSDDISEDDLLLCKRLISAYHSSVEKKIDGIRSPMWNDILENKQNLLVTILKEKDPRRLAFLLSKMLRSKIVYGIDSGILYNGRNYRIHSLKLLDDLVSLAESLGVVRVESSQGTVGHAFESGLENLVQRIQQVITIDIGVPSAGGPYGILVGKQLLTLQSLEYVYVACRIKDALSTWMRQGQVSLEKKKTKLLEVGAGYGGTANYILRLMGGAIDSYQIIDLPEANVLQGYYLAKSIGQDRVQLFGEKIREINGIVRIYPTHAIDGIREIDFVINQNSMPEIPLQAAEDYCTWIKNNAKLFYSYNHESLTTNREFAVTTVQEVIKKVGGFNRLSRNPSWLRPGYVEEVFATVNISQSGVAVES